jgi:hypothetical protein
MNPTCETCRYFVLLGAISGQCFRYPKTEEVSAGHGCGEHQPREAAVEKAPSLKDRDRQRRTGQYWVKTNFRSTEWEVAYWQSDDCNGGTWELPCSAQPRWQSHQFLEIDERRIERSPDA